MQNGKITPITPIYKLTVYVPQSKDEVILEKVKQAMFAAGAGKLGNYSHCCWQILGTGQFKPLVGSNPHIGKQNTITAIPEWRVECVITHSDIKAVILAMKSTHPYETPAYDVVKILTDF